MLSIIISTYQPDLFNALEKNIAATCGVPYEIIKIENPGIMGICKAYNKGAEKSRFEYLVFVHEDVSFDRPNWGKKIAHSFSNENVGVVGVAGAFRKFHLPYGFQSLIPNDSEVYINHIGSPSSADSRDGKKNIEAKVLDGVFLCTKKIVWEKFKFDETIKGYHFYDIDFTLRVSEYYTNLIATNIEITHFSMGKFNDSWITACLKFNNRIYNNFDDYTKEDLRIIQKRWYTRLMSEDINFWNRVRYIFAMKFDMHTKKSALNFLLKKEFFK